MTYTREEVEKILRDNGVDPKVLDQTRVYCGVEQKDYVTLLGVRGHETRDLQMVDGGKNAAISLDVKRAAKLIGILQKGFLLAPYGPFHDEVAS